MLTNIDTEMRKVSLETRRLEMKMETTVTEDTAESRENVNNVKAEVDALRNKLDTRSDDSDDVQQEFSAFKSEVSLSLKKLERDSSKIGQVVEASIIDKNERYISTEVVEEIVSTINNKLGSFKAEIGHYITKNTGRGQQNQCGKAEGKDQRCGDDEALIQ